MAPVFGRSAGGRKAARHAPSGRRGHLLGHHPIYVERESKEHPLLEDLIRRDPPSGGLAAYIADLDRSA